MQKGMLEKLYDGEFNPSEKIYVYTKEYKDSMNKLEQLNEKLINLLNEEQNELYEKITDENLIMCGISEEIFYKEGFRMGAKLMIDIYNK